MNMNYDHLADVFAKAFADTRSLPDALRVVDEYRAWAAARRRSDLHPQLIVEVAAAFYGMSPSRIYSGSRQRVVCEARWVVARALHILGWPSVQIGYALGRDHSSILHALNCVKDRPELVAAADQVLQMAMQGRNAADQAAAVA